ncbi:hypothetical protein ACFY15_34695, partial [Streptomyces sp. NPDC001373]
LRRRRQMPRVPHQIAHTPPTTQNPNRFGSIEQGVDLVVIKELLGHAHIGVTAGVYAHVRLRLQRQAIDALGNAFTPTDNDSDDPPAAAVVH